MTTRGVDAPHFGKKPPKGATAKQERRLMVNTADKVCGKRRGDPGVREGGGSCPSMRPPSRSGRSWSTRRTRCMNRVTLKPKPNPVNPKLYVWW
eukprot:160314-Chlamydomonas_euryale.AAC.1